MSLSVDARIGTELVGYRIEALLGRGGMGVVYRAYDPRLKRRVALKLLAPELAGDERFRERFLRESELAASLDHQGIVPIYEARSADGVVVIAMRYVEGADLRRLLREQQPLEPSRALAVCAQIADALDAAHEKGLVHRDVKPSNVLVDERGHCYLADFGLTRRVADQDDLERGQSLGTPDYLAPEQIERADVGPAADVYSLGCLLYECLTGEPPFRRSSDFATLFAHLEEAPPSASALRPELPVEIDAVLARALAKDPAARHATCRELVEAAGPALGIEAPAPASRTRSLLTSLAVALLVAAGLLAFFLTQGGNAPAAAEGMLVRVDPKTNEAKDTIGVGAGATAVVASNAAIWVAAFEDGSLWRVDPRGLGPRKVPSVGEPHGLAEYGGTVYVGALGPGASDNVATYDAATGRRTGGVQVFAACAVAAGALGVWVAGCPDVNRLSSRPPLRIEATTHIPSPSPDDTTHHRWMLRAMALGEGALWVLGDAADRRLWRIDPATQRIVATVRLPFAPADVAAGAGGVWVTDEVDDTVVRIDPVSKRIVAVIPVGRGAGGVAFGAGAVWVTGFVDETVSRIDPRTNRVVATIRVGGSPRDVAVGAGSVWTVGDAA